VRRGRLARADSSLAQAFWYWDLEQMRAPEAEGVPLQGDVEMPETETELAESSVSEHDVMFPWVRDVKESGAGSLFIK